MDEEDVLELGGRRSRHSRLMTALALLVVAGGTVGYLATRGGGERVARQAAPSTAAASLPAPSPTPTLPQWPQVPGACGSTAFLPIVSALPLHQRTGIRAIAGGRLSTVDVDTGAVAAMRGMPRGQYASDLATTADGTYALVAACSQTFGGTATVARVDPSGALRTIARGPYSELLSGGDHPWGVVFSSDSNTATLDPLDGGRHRTLPSDFGPVAAYRNLVVGTVNLPNQQDTALFTIRVLDPVTRHVRLDLGPATSVTVDRGLIVWTGANCASCRLQTYDLATGVRTTTRTVATAVTSIWGGVVSPDRRSVALIRQRSAPAPFEMDHPGNPNEIVIVDLVSGAAHVVPGVALWPKSPVGLAFSADSRWLAISLDEGSSVRLLVWRPGTTAPLQSSARIAGPVATLPGLAVA